MTAFHERRIKKRKIIVDTSAEMTDQPSDVCVWTYHERLGDDCYISWWETSCGYDPGIFYALKCPGCGKLTKYIEAEE